MTDRALELLSEIVAPVATEADLRFRQETAVKLAIEDVVLPPLVEAALNSVIAKPTAPNLLSIQQAVIRSGLWCIGVGRYVDLVARLATERHVEMFDAARALASVPERQRSVLPEPAKHLLQVADAVVEDDNEGIMKIEDDSVFSEALQALFPGRTDDL